MAKTVVRHKHKMKLTTAGKKGYTFTCSIEPCERQFSLSKKDFWGSLDFMKHNPLTDTDWRTPLGFPKTAFDA